MLCSESDHPSWRQGSLPHCAMPVTSLAACLPSHSIGAAVLQISISARDTQLPLKMPDIRLQAIFSSPRSPITPYLREESIYAC
jgi:hypothetical protein